MNRREFLKFATATIVAPYAGVVSSMSIEVLENLKDGLVLRDEGFLFSITSIGMSGDSGFSRVEVLRGPLPVLTFTLPIQGGSTRWTAPFGCEIVVGQGLTIKATPSEDVIVHGDIFTKNRVRRFCANENYVAWSETVRGE